MRKAVIVVIILVIAVIGSAAYFGPEWAEKKIEEKIQSIPFISYDSMVIDVSQRTVKFYNLKGEKAGYTAEVNSLEINDLKLSPILLNRRFIIDEIKVDGLKMDYQLNHKLDDESERDINNNPPKENDIPEFDIKSIFIVDGSFTLFDQSKHLLFSTRIEASLEHLNNRDILKPSTIPARLTKLDLTDTRYFTLNKLYKINVAETKYENQEVSIKKVEVTCNKNKYELGRFVGHETEWFDVKITSIDMRLSEMESLLKSPKIEKIAINQPFLKAFRDKRLPFPESQRPPLIRDILSNESFAFSFDTISIKGGHIEYESFVKEEKGPGVISFENLDADITGFSSYHLGLKHKPRLVATCKLYGKSTLFADVSFPASASSTDTWVKGKLLDTDLTIFNRMIQYVSTIEIKSGHSEFLEFDFTHNATNSLGDMKFAYSDLAVSFLSPQESESKGFFNKAKSFLVNSFVIDSNNNFDKDKFRLGKIDVKRDERKSIFNFWSSSILAGFKSSTGVDATGEKIDVN